MPGRTAVASTGRSSVDAPAHRRPDLRRIVGNGSVAALAEPSGVPASAGRPRISIREVGLATRPATGPDKSTSEGSGEQDQSMDTPSVAKESRGLGITVEMSGATSSAAHPDGYHWTQTIDTNVPLGGSTSPYVDPRPNDDTLPFYWTAAEAAARPTTFEDHPSRAVPASGVTRWEATLALNGVHKAKKVVKLYDCIRYGFTLDSAGKVTLIAPKSAAGTTHRSTLAGEFSDWTFT